MYFPRKSLYLVTDKNLSLGRELPWIVENAILGGVDIVQYREKNFQFKTHLKEAESIHAVCKQYNTIYLINDRVDLCMYLGADGVHLGQSDMPVIRAREILGKDKIIGLSIESVKDWETCLQNPKMIDSVDYLALSPIFPTPTKTDTLGAWGLEPISEIKSTVKVPLVGIGGINLRNIIDVMNSGIDSIALVSAICSSGDPKKASRDLKSILLQAS